MTRFEKAVAVVGIALLVINGTVLFKQTKSDEEVLEIKTQIKDVKTTTSKLQVQVEQVQKVVLYKTKDKVAMTSKELDCLAKNIYHEAGVEDRAGKVAVAQVTVNRVNDGRWGNDVCKVVYSKAQFSWTLDKKKRTAQPKGELWEQSLAVAKEFQKGTRVKGLETAHYYHTDYIRQPVWARAMKSAQKIGQHIFYRG